MVKAVGILIVTCVDNTEFESCFSDSDGNDSVEIHFESEMNRFLSFCVVYTIQLIDKSLEKTAAFIVKLSTESSQYFSQRMCLISCLADDSQSCSCAEKTVQPD